MPRSGAPTLLHLVEQLARTDPDREVLVEVDGPARTYGELDAEIRRWAAALRDLGVRPGRHVAVMLPTSIPAYLSWLGIALAGAIEVPVNVAYRHRMLGYLLNDCGAEVLVVSARFLARIVEVAEELHAVQTLLVVPDGDAATEVPPELTRRFDVVAAESFVAGRAPAADLAPPQSHDLCCVMYTSGTTGPSKGVMMPWAVMRSLADNAFPEPPSTGATLYAPFPTFHLSGKMWLYMAVQAAGRLLVRERFDTGSFWADVRRYGVARTALIGAMPTFVAKQPERAEDRDNPLRDVVIAPMPADYRRFAARFGVRVCTAFAMTEAGMPLTAGWDPPNHRTCGRVVPGYEVRVVDDLDEEVGPGVVGELIVRSDRPWELNVGYLGMDAATVRAWRNGWFHTGDAFTYDEEGWFYFVDRKKDTIRRRGENVSSFEVEAEVLAHQDVAEVAAIAVPSDVGEDEIKVVVQLKPERTLAPEELIEFLAARMARFMVPRYVEFVPELPKTPTAKVRKVELRQLGITPATFDRETARFAVPQ